MESFSPAQDPWAMVLAPLRLRYVRESRSALDRLQTALDHLERDPADGAALQEAHVRFHACAGAGATYGFTAVSEIGSEGEAEASALLVSGDQPDGLQIERWRLLLAGLRRELDQEPGVDGPGDADAEPGIQGFGEGGTGDVLKMGAGRFAAGAAGGGPGVAPVGEEGAEPTAAALLGLASVRPLLSSAASQVSTARARVLSMEDDPVQAAFIQAVLLEAGYDVLSCFDPQRFAGDLESFRPDLVLCDIMLPGISGYQLVRALRQDPRHAGLPVLFLTTQGQMNARIESTLAGGDDHLVKPATPSQLLSAITDRLERSRRVELLFEHDELTRLLTRGAFLDHARDIVDRLGREPRLQAIWVILDIDNFASITNRYGPAASDGLLVATANLMRRRLGSLGTPSHLSRLDGDEFGALLEDRGGRETSRLLKHLGQEFAATEHHSPGRVPIRATLSAGAAVLKSGMDVDRWHEKAERALGAAKAAGRNRVELER